VDITKEEKLITMIIEIIDEEILELESSEGYKTSMNSYGAGYDAGYIAGLEKAMSLIKDNGV